VSANILQGDLNFAPNLPVRIVGDANPTRFCEPFKTHRYIDPITIDVIFVDDNVTDVDADAEFDPFVLRHVDILCGDAVLNFDGASYGINHAAEFNESAVPGILDNASAMISDFGIKKRRSESF
jgi:hypothetical protein